MELKVLPPLWTIFQAQDIPYVWGGTHPATGLDCFTLYNYLLYTGKGLILPGFDWIRGEYENHDDSPNEWVNIMALKLFGETGNEGVVGEPYHLHILNFNNRIGVGTIVKWRNQKQLVITGKNGSRVVPYSRYKTRVVRAYTPYNIAETAKDFYGSEV